MKAAVVTAFDVPPCCADHPEPHAAGPDDIVVDVLASGLHPRVRSQADGSHYTSTANLPLVPGIDGVGRAPDGVLRYFVLPDTTLGAMAERTVIDRRRSIELPAGTDPIVIAAVMNPAMSAWVALRRRTTFSPGRQVLVLGATGSAGQLAVQVARLLGAGRIVAAGRDPDKVAQLPRLGATDVVALDDDADKRLGEVAADVDVVLDYVWGEPAAAAMAAIVTARGDRSVPLTWIQIGSTAGRTAPVPSAALRACRLELIGSGQGSVGTREILAELPELAAHIAAGRLSVDVRAVPLADVERAWSDAVTTKQRLVVTP